MPGHAGSPFWAAVDFDSEGDEDNKTPSPNNRLYLDPWDTQAYGFIQGEPTESSHGENFNSSVGEAVSGNFYYVPTKNYDSDEEIQKPRAPVPESAPPDYMVYGRRKSRGMIPDHHSDMTIYGDRQMRLRRRSVFVDEPVYEPHPLLYEAAVYGQAPMLSAPPPGFVHPQPMSRMSVAHHPDYAIYGKSRRHSRLTDPYEQFTYESLSPEYEDWARPFPKAIPDNFHLSRYGHLQIDYSFSWNSLDRLIRNK